MKLGLMIGTPDLRQPWIVALDGPDLEANFRIAAEWGYHGVELALRDPALLNGEQIKIWLARYGLEMIGLCTGEIFGSDGLGLVAEREEVMRAAEARMCGVIDLAAQFGPGTLVNIGRVRGALRPGHSLANRASGVAVFRRLAEYAAPRGVRLALEPINHYEVNYILSTPDGVEIADEVNHPNFGLMLDTYHMNIEDRNLHASLRGAQRYCWHVHVSDNNRRWPGNAHIDFPALLATLHDLGYTGYLSAEILPWPNRETAGRETVRYLQRCLQLLAE